MRDPRPHVETVARRPPIDGGLASAVDVLGELETIYATAPIGLAVFDRDLRFVRVNERLAEINGASVESHLGRSVREMVPDLSEQAEAALRHVLETGTPLRDVEFVGETPARPGVKRTWIESWSPVRDTEGRILGVSIVAQEVTELRDAVDALARRERAFARIAENAPAIIARIDRGLRHVYVNRAVEAVTGRTVAEYLGRTNRELGMPGPLCDTWDAAFAAAFRGEPQRLDFSFDAPGGARHYEWTVVPEPDDDGRIDTVLTIAHDVTDRVVAAQALREADARKDQFLATLAHELRNPLAPLRTGLRVAERGDLPAQSRRAIAMCVRQVEHMTRLVDDLLEVSRISRGKIRLRPENVMVPAAIYAVAEAIGPTLEERGQHLQVDLPQAPFRAEVDPTRFAQIVENLLSNASKYTDAGGTVTVRARCDDETVTVAVSDTGIGFGPGEASRLFALFSQLEAGIARAQGGLGIGLALVRGLAEAHGGSVEARSDGPGRGSTFTVVLPRDFRADAGATDGE